MSVTVEQNGAIARRLIITIPGESIEAEMAGQLQALGKNANIKGFRPGKAPAKIVRREYGAAVRGDAIDKLSRSHYAEALRNESLEPVALPTFNEGETGEGGDYIFSADLEVFPEVEPRGLDTLEITRPKVEINDSDVDTVIERLQKQHAEWLAVTRSAQEGDKVTVNFEGLIEGEPFEGNQGVNVAVTIGAGEMIPGFEEGLKGIGVDETRKLELAFPEDYRAEEVAGKQAIFEVSATAIEAENLPEVNDAFAATFGCEEGVEQLRERVRNNMESELETRIGEDLHDQVGDQLIDANPTEVPRALVDREIERRQTQMLRRLGLDPESSTTPNLPREPYEEVSKRHVRLGLVMNALLEREAFQPDPALVEKRIESLTAQMEDPTAAAREVRADNQAMRNIEAMVLEDMIYDWLIEQAKVSEEEKDFLTYMEPKQELGQGNTGDASNG
jgi:trigger factor